MRLFGVQNLRGFIRKSSDITRKLKQLFNALTLLVNDPFHPILKTHKLVGPLKGNYAFSLGYDLRVVFKFLDKEAAFLETIGTHEEVY